MDFQQPVSPGFTQKDYMSDLMEVNNQFNLSKKELLQLDRFKFSIK
jgi:hypothetical protein